MSFSPSIVSDGVDQDVYLVLNQFERVGRAWFETDEADTDFQTLIRHLLEGQFSNPVRVVAFNTAEGLSRDVSDDVADELRGRCADRGETQPSLLEFLEAMILVNRFNCCCLSRRREKLACFNIC
jgi:hypothetical protein